MSSDRSGVLYVVATPLGNLEDLSARALRVFREVEVVACEDTRRTGPFLRARGITTPLVSCHEHNERARAVELVARLNSGASVALVSDAGTPAISDPGEHVVRAVRDAGLAVVPIPGPSALVAALSVSGLPAVPFLFVGFLPSRAVERRRVLATLKEREETLVFYESPVRIRALLADAEEILGDRMAFLCREATKVHEEYIREPLSVLGDRLDRRGAVKGEIVLVVAGAAADQPAIGEHADVDTILDELAQRGLAPRAASREASRRTGMPARDLYQRIVRRTRSQ